MGPTKYMLRYRFKFMNIDSSSPDSCNENREGIDIQSKRPMTRGTRDRKHSS